MQIVVQGDYITAIDKLLRLISNIVLLQFSAILITRTEQLFTWFFFFSVWLSCYCETGFFWLFFFFPVVHFWSNVNVNYSLTLVLMFTHLKTAVVIQARNQTKILSWKLLFTSGNTQCLLIPSIASDPGHCAPLKHSPYLPWIFLDFFFLSLHSTGLRTVPEYCMSCEIASLVRNLDINVIAVCCEHYDLKIQSDILYFIT